MNYHNSSLIKHILDYHDSFYFDSNQDLDEIHADLKLGLKDNILTINGDEFVIDDRTQLENDISAPHQTEIEQRINSFENSSEQNAEEINYRPIIGILAQELSSSLEPWYGDNYTSYIGAAYVKYVEQAGARVVPVLIDQTEEYYDTIFKSTNGLLIPGGAVSIVDSGLKLNDQFCQFQIFPMNFVQIIY